MNDVQSGQHTVAGGGSLDPPGRRLAPGCRLLPAHEADPAELLRFEADERDHFRRWIPDRGESYYNLAAVEQSLRSARKWWDAGSDMLHVVVDDRDRLLARVNLVDIADDRAEVGYRVARAATGRGIATAGVTALLATARDLGLNQVRASTSTKNEASARVLVRCGFVRAGLRPAAMEVEGRRLDARDWYIDLA